MKLIYVAGPFRGKNSWDMENNIRRAEALALEVWRLGAAAICPHCNTRFFQGAAPDEVWLSGTLEMLRRCDAVITTHDWQLSKGARAEVAEAYTRGIPVFSSISTVANLKHLYEWLTLQVEVDATRELQKSREKYNVLRACERNNVHPEHVGIYTSKDGKNWTREN